jgi:hypothetical protein
LEAKNLTWTNNEYSELFYALTGREIHFQDDITGIIKVIGIRKTSTVSTDNDTVEYGTEYPLIYVYKILSVLCKEPVSKIFKKKYDDHITEARRNLSKQTRFGRTFPVEI